MGRARNRRAALLQTLGVSLGLSGPQFLPHVKWVLHLSPIGLIGRYWGKASTTGYLHTQGMWVGHTCARWFQGHSITTLVQPSLRYSWAVPEGSSALTPAFGRQRQAGLSCRQPGSLKLCEDGVCYPITDEGQEAGEGEHLHWSQD